MIPADYPEHSPLGGSSMERKIACPGSTQLDVGCVDEESEYAAEGTAAHALGEYCLFNEQDAWERIGNWISDDFRVDKDMSDAVQIYLDELELAHPRADRTQANTRVEQVFYCPSLHKYFWGKADFVFIDEPTRTLHVWDYKHGAGIMVFPEKNVQCMYYGCGTLEELGLWDAVDTVVLHIVQPRGYLDPHRSWKISVVDLEDWLDYVLLPAMDNALVSTETASGEHCRFCPVRNYACPQLVADMEEFEKMVADLESGKRKIEDYTPEQLGRFLDLRDLAKGTVGKAADKVAFGRLQAGVKIPGRKLGNARSNREWKDEKKATAALKKTLGDKAFVSKLVSPAQAEKLPGGAALATRHAHKPPAGLTILPDSDPRRAVNRDTKSMFKPTKQKGRKKDGR